MINFGLGFLLCAILTTISERVYKKGLTLTANSHQSEKILGKWYRIQPDGHTNDPDETCTCERCIKSDRGGI